MAEKRSNIGWWIFGVAIVGIPLLYYLLLGGRVDGEEFSPDDFSRRYFSYNIMPIFNVCLRGIEYQDKTPVFEQTLLADGYLGKTAANNSATRRWHLIDDSQSDLESRDFDAHLLIRFLDLVEDETESIWIKWNEDFPDLATTFWPIVADMARAYQYVELTDIMARAKILTAEGVDDFEKFMIATASSSFFNEAELLKENGEFERALDLYQKSYDLSPSEQSAAGKLECLDLLGQNESSSVKDVQAEVDDQ